ncbi:prolyl oligopeptidase family serine peptidase [Planococcus versutus]|uniref:Peptidase S9 prolyl oligopeptidase catalytic domain-containing protein n=1 Tax=Planococcus versutus TaxID=1302659 RepID=A0A1B1RYE0_9BACL|nr:prolyl oligopeptidase family serine peptidase [Planococcus versutus]ANU25946.1 hypothetical protein I858_002615 [Planococcus versutus]
MKKPIELSDVHSLISVTDPRISPDEKSIIFVQKKMDEEENTYNAQLFQMDLESGQQLQWTSGKKQVSSPRWSGDGKNVAFLSYQDGKNQLYSLSISDKKIYALMDGEQNIDRFEWAACGTKIWINGFLRKNKELFQKKYPEQTSCDNNRQIGLIDCETKNIELVLSGGANYQLEAVSHSGKKVVYGLCTASLATQVLYVYDIDTKQHIQVSSEQGCYFGAAFSRDDSKIAFTGSNRRYGNATHTELYIADLQAQTSFCLTESIDVPVGDFAKSDIQRADAPAVVWTIDDHLYFRVSTMGDVRLYFASLEGMIFPASPDMEHVYSYDVSKDGSFAVLAISNSLQPGELYRLSITTGEMRPLTSFNQLFIRNTKLANTQSTITTNAKNSVHGWLTEPIGRQKKQKYPLIIKVQESSQDMNTNTFSLELQLLANEGLGVFYANPSGSHGYSQEFANAKNEDAQEDWINAIEEIIQATNWIDVRRIAIVGSNDAQLLMVKLKSKMIKARFIFLFESSQPVLFSSSSDFYITQLQKLLESINKQL